MPYSYFICGAPRGNQIGFFPFTLRIVKEEAISGTVGAHSITAPLPVLLLVESGWKKEKTKQQELKGLP